MDAAKFSEEVERRGCSIRCGADSDATTIHISGLGEWLDDMIALASDALLHPVFDETELDKLRTNLIADMMVELVDVEWLAARACASRAYVDHPYRHPKNGTPESLRMLRRDDLMRAHQRMCASERFVIVAGPVDAEAVTSKLSDALSNMPAPLPLPLPPRVHVSGGFGVLAAKDDAVQTAFRILLPGVNHQHADYAAMHLVANVLGGYTLARLFTILREEKGYTYGAYAFPSVRPLSASISIVTSVGNEFTADTLDTIAQELDRISHEIINVDEFENARQTILGSFARNCETPQQTASLIYTMLQYGLPMDYFERHIDKIQTLEAIDVQSAQQAYFQTTNWIVGCSGVGTIIESAVRPHVQKIEYWSPSGYSQ